MLNNYFKFGFLALTLMIALGGSAHAKTPLTGTAYGKNIGVVHMDYATATRPDDYAGPQKDFYFDPTNPDFSGPGVIDFTAHIYDMQDEDKCDENTCLMTGFMWTDSIGWIILDGEQIQNGMDDPNDFPVDFFATIHFDGPLTGYLWSENAGWIKLSLNVPGSTTPTSDQNQDDWGIWYGPSAKVDANGTSLGNALQGYAFSEKMGWIKFEPEGDENFKGVFTHWQPDETPPELYGEDQTWFANLDVNGVVHWPGFSEDPESGIRDDSIITVAKDPDPKFANCNQPVNTANNIEGNTLSFTIPAIGLITGTAEGYCKYTLTGEIYNHAGFVLKIGGAIPEPPHAYHNPLTFYVRAGTYDEVSSAIILPASNTAFADGESTISYILSLTDVAQNPIVTVSDPDCADCPERHINVTGSLENQMMYDTINLDGSLPVKVNDVFLNQHGTVTSSPLNSVLDKYPAYITSFAPSTPINTLEFLQFDIEITDDALPGITVNHDPVPAVSNTHSLMNIQPNKILTYKPGVEGVDGKITSSELITGVGTTLEFSLRNTSQTKTINHIDYDLIFEYSDDGLGWAATAETQRIDHQSAAEDVTLGWTDPIDGESRYEIYNGDLANDIPIQGNNSLFHEQTSPFAGIDNKGIYPVAPEENVPGDSIDRNDPVLMSIAADEIGALQSIDFTPDFTIPPDQAANVNMNIRQQIGYRYDNQPQFAIYENNDELVSDLSVKMVGASFSGLGSGDHFFETMNDFNTIGSKSIRGLKEQIRRNVAENTFGLSACSSVDLIYDNIDGALRLKTNAPCIKEVGHNQLIAYYKGGKDDILELGDGNNETLFVPQGYKFTLILEGGINVFFRNNLAYNNITDSFGLILLSDINGEGANVFIDPAPTNLIGIVYAEGSVRSSNHPSGNAFYYVGSEDTNELKNQLYWQGRIVSRNSFGGASVSPPKVPDSAPCPPASTVTECAQEHDLNFIRRFSAATDNIAGNGFFSGGGSCEAEICFNGPLPTTITLDGEGGIDKALSKSLDAFFIEPVNRPAPPAFSIRNGLESSSVTR